MPRPRSASIPSVTRSSSPASASAGEERWTADGLGRLLRRGTGAALQRRVHRETRGDLGAVVRTAVALTVEEPEGTAQATPRGTD